MTIDIMKAPFVSLHKYFTCWGWTTCTTHKMSFCYYTVPQNKIVVSTQKPTPKDLSFVNGSHHCQTVVNRQTKQKYWSHSEEFLEYSEPVSVRACSPSSIHRTKISPTLSPSFEPWSQVEVSLSSKQFSCQKKL